MASIFLSHSSQDKPFASRLAGDLQRHGHRVWLDQWKIGVGASIPSVISLALEEYAYVGVILTPESLKSQWVTSEWEAKYWDEINRRRIMVLPIVAKRCLVPTLLRTKRYADFTKDYLAGLVDLLLALRSPMEPSGIRTYSSDVVAITEEFETLIERSTTADLLVMYGATWRNTWRASLVRMLKKRRSRLRVALAAVDRDSALLSVYARRLNSTRAEVLSRFRTAVREFKRIPASGTVEIYTVRSYLNQALYLFDQGAVLSVYSYRERERTPALITHDGDLQQWLREEFEGVINSKELLAKRIWRH